MSHPRSSVHKFQFQMQIQNIALQKKHWRCHIQVFTLQKQIRTCVDFYEVVCSVQDCDNHHSCQGRQWLVIFFQVWPESRGWQGKAGWWRVREEALSVGQCWAGWQPTITHSQPLVTRVIKCCPSHQKVKRNIFWIKTFPQPSDIDVVSSFGHSASEFKQTSFLESLIELDCAI